MNGVSLVNYAINEAFHQLAVINGSTLRHNNIKTYFPFKDFVRHIRNNLNLHNSVYLGPQLSPFIQFFYENRRPGLQPFRESKSFSLFPWVKNKRHT